MASAFEIHSVIFVDLILINGCLFVRNYSIFKKVPSIVALWPNCPEQ